MEDLSLLIQQSDSANGQQRLEEAVRYLIVHDIDTLIAALYRIDVSEQRLKEALSAGTNEDTAKLITAFIIERQLQKLHSKETFKQGNDIDDAEKW